MKKILTVMFVMCIFSAAHGEDKFSWGFRIGSASHNTKVNSTVEGGWMVGTMTGWDENSNSSLSFSGFIDYDVNRFFSVQGELSYYNYDITIDGRIYSDVSDSSYSSEYVMDSDIFSVPLLMKGKLLDKGIKLNVFAGYNFIVSDSGTMTYISRSINDTLSPESGLLYGMEMIFTGREINWLLDLRVVETKIDSRYATDVRSTVFSLGVKF